MGQKKGIPKRARIREPSHSNPLFEESKDKRPGDGAMGRSSWRPPANLSAPSQKKAFPPDNQAKAGLQIGPQLSRNQKNIRGRKVGAEPEYFGEQGLLLT